MKNLVDTTPRDALRFLGEWSTLTTKIYRTAEFEVEPVSSRITCAVLLPNREKLQVQADSIEDVTIELAAAIQAQLKHARCHSRWTPEWQALLQNQKASSTKEAAMDYEMVGAGSVGRTKERQETIGVTSKKSLYEMLTRTAELENTNISCIARTLVTKGFNDFEERTYSENPKKLLEEFERKLDGLEGAETTQWMLRLSRHESLRLKFAAKEYGRSVSRIAAICLNDAFQRKYSYLFDIPLQEIEATRSAIQLVKGPAVRRVAEQVGLTKSSGPLISGVLAGRIVGPARLIELLSNALGVSQRALRRVVSEAFNSSPVPAYKADGTKPVVLASPEAWGVAVKSLRLPADETMLLLDLQDNPNEPI